MKRDVGNVGEQGLEADESEEEESGQRKVIKLNDPKEPSEQEKKEHEMTHLPFRSWCRHCVRGRGKEAAHRKQTDGGGLH